MTYQELVNELNASSNQDYKEFSEKIGKNSLRRMGVTFPKMQDLVKKHYLDEDLDLSEFELNKYLELNYIYIAINLKRLKDFDKMFDFIKNNLEIFNSWELTDSLPRVFKKLKYQDFLKEYVYFTHTSGEFSQRIGYVIGLNYYKEPDISLLIKEMKQTDYYYTNMGMAWLLATLAIKHFDIVYDVLKSDRISLDTKKKAASKMIESFRITEENKNRIKILRTNNYVEE